MVAGIFQLLESAMDRSVLRKILPDRVLGSLSTTVDCALVSIDKPSSMQTVSGPKAPCDDRLQHLLIEKGN